MIVGAGAEHRRAGRRGRSPRRRYRIGRGRARRCWRRSSSWLRRKRSAGSSTPVCSPITSVATRRSAKAGRTVNGNIAAIVAHENASARMVKAGVPDAARPFNTYFETVARLPVQRRAGDAVPRRIGASDDTGTIVMFRRSDVIAAGDLFSTDSYPVIDLANGGSVQGTIAGLNRILDLAVPSKYARRRRHVRDSRSWPHLRRDTTCAMYRDMLRHHPSTGSRDMVEKKMTLDQVQGGAADARLRRPLRRRHRPVDDSDVHRGGVSRRQQARRGRQHTMNAPHALRLAPLLLLSSQARFRPRAF